MNTKRITVGPYEVNCSIIWGETKQALLIDPGYDAGDIEAILQANGLSVAAYLLTHGHADHISALAELHAAHPAPVYRTPPTNAGPSEKTTRFRPIIPFRKNRKWNFWIHQIPRIGKNCIRFSKDWKSRLSLHPIISNPWKKNMCRNAIAWKHRATRPAACATGSGKPGSALSAIRYLKDRADAPTCPAAMRAR